MSASRWIPSAALLLAAALALPSPATAQHEEPPPPAAYALEDVTVHHADGRLEEGVTVVVRGGLIRSLGSGTEPPADARVLEGSGLRVYPGIVDAWGRAELDLPERPDPADVTPWAPSRVEQGFTPHLRVADRLDATGGAFEERRAQGIVASGVFPDRGLAPGVGAALLHRVRADVPRELVVRPELGLALSFEEAPGGYPSTLFGVIAFLRQSFEDAERTGRLRSEYRRDPTGMTAPPWDPDHEVLRRVAAGELRVFFAADGAEDIRRALGLARELGFDPVIVGGGGAWEVADELADGDVPVLVSVDFPEPEEWDPEAEEEPDPGAARERERLESLYANAARLSEAGVELALTSGGGEADLREGVRTVIEYGLPEEDALRALSATPARLLGVAPLVRLAPGSGASFVVTDGALFDEETRIVYVFVEGELEEPEVEPPPDEAPADEPGRGRPEGSDR